MRFPRPLCIIQLLALVASCKTPNSQCTSSSQCANGYTCDPSSNQCVVTTADAAAVDAEIDATPACPVDTHVCAGAPPVDWNGPVMRAHGAMTDTLAECAAETEARHVYGELLAEGDCTCSCGAASNVVCSNGSVQSREGTSAVECLQLCSAGPACSVSLPPTTCQSITSLTGDAIRINVGNISSATCSAATTTDSIDEARFEEQSRYCSTTTETELSCGGQDLCVAKGPEGFAPEMCIFREGDHACPESGPYTERFVEYQGIDDQRSCNACGCQAPSGSCGGSVVISDGTCAPITTATGGCMLNLNTYQTATYTPGAHSCTPTGGGVSGAATATGPVTFCCQAPAE